MNTILFQFSTMVEKTFQEELQYLQYILAELPEDSPRRDDIELRISACKKSLEKVRQLNQDRMN